MESTGVGGQAPRMHPLWLAPIPCTALRGLDGCLCPAELAPEHPGYVEAMLAVVELHRELGQPQEADRWARW